MGLILKWREMREKMRHCEEGNVMRKWMVVECEGSHLQVLDEIVEHPETFGVFRVLDVDEGADFGGLDMRALKRRYRKGSERRELTSKAMWSLPILISSSCFPTMFFLGQLVSSSLAGGY
jgi:hypothetical protein